VARESSAAKPNGLKNDAVDPFPCPTPHSASGRLIGYGLGQVDQQYERLIANVNHSYPLLHS
jgi:hypothetical protein